MEIKKISLENIRSYEKQEIEFPEGSILLSGDIGTGKTSVLLAIEFALFGLQPGQRGASLLKNGKNTGRVILEFNVEGKEVKIERTLKRTSTSISQDSCVIFIDGIREEISVMELKNRVLELLNYPPEFSKRQNILYKFTVYTPQEEMKQIILQNPDVRLNTLRHVFGIEKYKRILENSSILTSKIREEIRIKKALIANLEADKENLISKESELETKYSNLDSVEKELFMKKERREEVEEEKKEIEKKINEKNKLQHEIEKTKIVISNKKDSLIENVKIIKQLDEQIEELKKIKFSEGDIEKIDKEILKLKEEKGNLDEKNLNLTAKISSLKLKNFDTEKIKEGLKRIDICPTCLQDVDAVYKSNVINKIDSDLSENINKIKELILEKEILSKKITNISNEIFDKQNEKSEIEKLKIRLQNSTEKEIRLKEIKKNNINIENDIELLKKHVDSLGFSISELKKYEPIFEQKELELKNSFREEKEAEIKKAELNKEIEVFSRQIEELRGSINKTEEIKNKLNHLLRLEDWISNKFTGLISFIEKNVMIKLQTEFSKLFSEWFSMLVSENFDVRLSDDFTPIIEQQDYEIEYEYLSGGERTAIALAYRLALNQVINSLLSKINTRDIVILDEPTDGFSGAQLDKMRDVLQQLNVKQLIIVSHEQKIEGFVENLIRFKKSDGISVVEAVKSH